MTPAVERKERIGRCTSDRSKSPVMSRHAERRRSSPHREMSPVRRRTSPRKRTRSPMREKLHDRRPKSPVRTTSQSPSPRIKRSKRAQDEREGERVTKREHGRDVGREERDKGGRDGARTSSPRSPSPRTKRLLRAQAGRDAEKITEREDDGRNSSREVRDKGTRGEREARDGPSERRAERNKDDNGSNRAMRRDRPVSPDRSHRGKHSSRSPPRVSSERRSERDKNDNGSSRSMRRDRSISPLRASGAGARDEVTNPRATEQLRDDDLDSIAKMKAAEESLEEKNKDKVKPSFELSGKLAEETNRVRGVTLLFNEPADARKPDVRWRLYVFKAGEVLNEPLYVHRQSCYLFGRERRVADIPTDHPSCSKQHAVIQYRLVETEQPDGLLSKQVRPYLMDLGSTNGTFINDNRIEPQRYYELIEKDTIRFGNSSREYVILHENSAGT